MYVCHRCYRSFSTVSALKKHCAMQEIPCDLYCACCDEKFQNRHSFTSHRENCNPVNVNDMDLEQVNYNNRHNSKRDLIHTNNLDRSLVKKYGIRAHEMEFEYFVNDNFNELFNLFKLHTNEPCASDIYMEILMNVIKLIYSNPFAPHHINICCGENKSDHNFIFDGKMFIKDPMKKIVRNRRI